MAAPTLFASNEFGFALPDFSAGDESSASQAPTSIGSVQTAATAAWHQHPTVAIVAIVGVTAWLVGSAAKPVSARASGNVGPAKGSIEGEI